MSAFQSSTGLALCGALTTIFLFIAYFVVVTPCALVLKLLRVDLLGLSFDRGKSSYWIDKKASHQEFKTIMKRQY